VRALEDVVQEALDHNKVKAEDIDLWCRTRRTSGSSRPWQSG